MGLKIASTPDPFIVNMMESLSEALIFVDQQVLITRWNPAAEHLYGWTAEEVLGKPFSDIIPTQYLHTNRQDALREVQQTGRWAGEVIHPHKDGTPLPIWSSVSAVQDETGQRLGLVGLNRDLTPQKQAEDTLRQSEARFALAFRSNPNAMLLSRESDGLIYEVNEQWEHVTGFPQAETLAQTTLNLGLYLHPSQRETVLAKLHAEHTLRNYETAFRHKSGEIRYISVSIETLQIQGESCLLTTLQDITEPKRAAQALQQSEETYRYLFANHPHPMWIYALDTLAFLEVNEAAQEKYGYTRAEFLQMTLKDIRPPEDLPRLFDNLAQPRLSLEHSENWHHRLKDGRIIDVSITSHALQFHGHEAVLVIAEDITERRQAEKALLESERRYRLISENSGDVIWTLDPATQRFTYVSPSVFHLRGLTPEEVMAEPMEASLTPASYQQIATNLPPRVAAFLAGDVTAKTRVSEVDQYRKDGSIVHTEVATTLVTNAEGRLVEILGITRDITERKQAEANLRVSEERYRHLIEHMNDLVMEVDAQGNFTYLSPNYQALSGYTPEKELGRSAFTYVHPDDRPWLIQKFKQIAESQRMNALYRVQIQSGAWRWMETSGTLYRAEDGSLRTIGVARDITERKEAEEALQKSETLLSEAQRIGQMGHWEWTAPGKELVCSEALFQILEIHQESKTISPLTIAAMLPPEDRPRLHALDHQAFVNRTDADYEYQVTLPSGRMRWLHQHMNITYGQDGQLVRMMGIIQDITGRKQTEQALQASQRRFQALIEHAPDGIALLGQEGKLRQITPSTEQILGYTLEDAKDQDPAHLVHPDELPALLTLLMDLIEHPGKVVRTQYRFLHKNGTWRCLDCTISNLLADPAIEAILFNYRDITDQKRAEETIRASEARFATVFQFSPIPIALTRLKDNHLLDVNPAWSAITGWKKEEALALTPRELGTWFEPQAREQMINLLQTQGSVKEFELQMKQKSGELANILISAELVEVGGEHCMLSMAVDITDRKRTERELRHRTEDLTLINALNDAINRGETLEGITEVLARETRRVFGCQDATLYLLTPDGKSLEMQSTSLPKRLREVIEKIIGRAIPKVQIPLREDGYFKKFLANEQGTIIHDPEMMQKWIEEFTETTSLPHVIRATMRKFIPQIHALLNLRSTLTMPLVSFERAIGLLDLSSTHLFTEEDLARIRNISFQITAVVLRKQVEQQVQRQLKRMRALHEIDRAISASLDMRVSLTILLTELLNELEVDAASILLLNTSTYTLEHFASKGFHTLSIRQTRIRLGDGVAGQVGLERKVIHIPQLADPKVSFKRPDLLTEEMFIEYFGVPLIAKGQLKGVLEIFHRTPLTPNLDWANYLETLGGQAAIAIDNAQLFEGVQRTHLELSTAYDATIAGWSRALDLRDHETEGHSQRVTEMTLRLAEEMGISQADLVHIRRGALLHDIGKLGVPDLILLKPGKLTDEEWVVMHQHPTLAYDMLLPIQYLRPALDIPYCHHEKWDGTGYPRGLQGEQIPLAARIFAIVDVWDALRSDRPYRAGWSAEKIREYILEQTGKHFDPQVVKTFIPMLDHPLSF